MSIDVQYRNKTLFINKQPLNFDFEVGNAFVLENKIIFLLKIPYDNQETLQNIYCLNESCQFLWQVQSVVLAYPNLTEELSFDGIKLKNNGKISAYDFYGRNFDIDPQNGHITNFTVARCKYFLIYPKVFYLPVDM